MPRVSGDDVLIKYGGTTVPGVKSVSYTKSRPFVTSEIAGRDADHHGKGHLTVTGDITFERYPGDAAQAGLKSGLTISMTLFPEGDASGATEIAFDAVLGDESIANLGSTEFQTVTVSFANAGDITEGTVT